MQTKTDIEDWYKTADPWGYETNPDDLDRKKRILKAIPRGYYPRAIDIGCGEGWITKDLPADKIDGIEWSDTAAERLPDNVRRVLKPIGYYDLIIVTGVLYKQYDYEQIMSWVASHRTRDSVVVTCHIKDWEQELPIMRAEHVEEFPYRNYTQVLRVFK